MAQLNISLPQEDLDNIRQAAAARSVPISQFVRARVLQDASYGSWDSKDDNDYEEQIADHERRLQRIEEAANL